jgi:small subunit ribosomal protein S4
MYLKGNRCYTDKCAIDRRNYPPGQHGQGRSKFSEYGVQLREKQKVKRIYGLLEKQFRLYFKKADSKKGITGENLLFLLEKRLDNVVYRSGFLASRKESRQMIRHNHFQVNGRKVNIPSYIVKPGDVVTVIEKSRSIKRVQDSLSSIIRRGIPKWIELDKDNYKCEIKAEPEREDILMPINEQLIVELYSK